MFRKVKSEKLRFGSFELKIGAHDLTSRKTCDIQITTQDKITLASLAFFISNFIDQLCVRLILEISSYRSAKGGKVGSWPLANEQL